MKGKNMAKNYPHEFTPWHGVLYTAFGTEILHGALQMVNETVYRARHGIDYNQLTAINNYALAPHVRASSMPSYSTVNFGMPDWEGF